MTSIVDTIRQCRVCGQYFDGAGSHSCAPDARIRRISVVETDPGYSPEAMFCEVYLNGAPLQYCITADADRGEVTVYQQDANGKLIVDGEQAVTEVVRGHVEIRRIGTVTRAA